MSRPDTTPQTGSTPAGRSGAQSVDLTTCDREEIHLLGRVQSFGCLIAVSADWTVTVASENTADFLGFDADRIMGEPLREVLSREAIHAIRARLQALDGPDAVERLFGIGAITGSTRLYDIAIHRSGDWIVLEFERHAKSERPDHAAFVRPLIDRLHDCDTVDKLCRLATRQLRAMIGFDRVMVYRFHNDGSGEVVAEAVRAGDPPYLGLRYPASDIPKQARALYLRNRLRIISDVDDAGAEIRMGGGTGGAPLDLSLSTLRSVSPIHIEYLRNMNVAASLSISIVRDGKLWGLFACHHSDARVLGYELRSAAELFGLLFTYELEQREAAVERQQVAEARRLHDRLMTQLADDQSVRDNFLQIAHALKPLIPFDGVAGWIDGDFMAEGETPDEEEFLKLVRFLNTTHPSQIYSTDRLPEVFEPASGYADRASGLLAIPVSRTPRDFVVLFRRELARTVRWAGNPEKPVEAGPNGIRLTPRKSFEAWKEIVHGRSAPWVPAEIAAAESLRVTLLEVVLRMTESANRDRARAQQQQELLIAELNHRVRNILNLIRSLVTQSKSDVKSVTQFTEVVGGRIHALARAHDQITRENWSSSSLRKLIETETEAYLGPNASRVSVTGPDAELTPGAYTTLALVVHELTTNSAKYGALSDSRGRIEVTLEAARDGALEIGWREQGGPPVSTPTREGFGTTVIERSVPFDLRGTAEINFEPTGLTARFMIPPQHIAELGADVAKTEDEAPETPAFDGSLPDGDALLVEDNMIIALDGEDMLTELGAETVHVAASVDEAMRLIDGKQIGFALLDVNLGSETSETIAARLQADGVPFAFTTGYGDALNLTRRFVGAPVLQKPFDSSQLAATLKTLRGA